VGQGERKGGREEGEGRRKGRRRVGGRVEGQTEKEGKGSVRWTIPRWECPILSNQMLKRY